jgi:hypothetical protein
MFSLVLFAALAQPGQDAAPGGEAPVQGLAVIDAKGKITITYVSCNCYGPGMQDNTVTAHEIKGNEKVPVQVKVKVSSVMVMTAELPAKHVEAYTADGKAISAEKLAPMLQKEHTVLIAMDGKKVDPFYLQLYKEGTIVLVPPSGTFGMGGAQLIAPGIAPDLPPLDIKPQPRIEDKKPDKDLPKEEIKDKLKP